MRSLARTAVVAATLSLVGAFSEAGAQTKYFGEDLKWVTNGSPLAGSNSAIARASFLSVLSGVGTESFEGFSVGAGAPLPLSFAGAGTATLMNNGNVFDGTDEFNRKATTGSKYWGLSTGQGGDQFTITFSQAIAAFGLYGLDVGDFGDQLTLSFYRNNALVEAWSPAHGMGGGLGGPNDGNLNFFGYINTVDLFDEVRFSSVGAASQFPDIWGFDDMTIGSQEQVPEPASLALVGTGLLGLAAARRRRRSA